MRRADKQITDSDELHRILDEALVLHLGMIDGERPYVVPLNFAREGDELWLHCAAEGRKLAACATGRASASRSNG